MKNINYDVTEVMEIVGKVQEMQKYRNEQNKKVTEQLDKLNNTKKENYTKEDILNILNDIL